MLMKYMILQYPIEMLVLHAYEAYINKDYYSYLKLPLGIMEVEDILALKTIIDKHSNKHLKEEQVDEALIKTLEGMKERVKMDIELMERANVNEEIKEIVYPFKVIMEHKKGV